MIHDPCMREEGEVDTGEDRDEPWRIRRATLWAFSISGATLARVLLEAYGVLWRRRVPRTTSGFRKGALLVPNLHEAKQRTDQPNADTLCWPLKYCTVSYSLIKLNRKGLSSALNLRTLSVGQRPSQSWYSGLSGFLGGLSRMNYCRASCIELSCAQGGLPHDCASHPLALGPSAYSPQRHSFCAGIGRAT